MTTWSLRGAEKAFPGVRALAGVDIDVREGEIHALVGENGCGKSTLIKLFAGVYTPDAGELLRGGEPVVLASPRAARRAGIATIYQERSLIGPLTVAENIAVGDYPTRNGLLDRKAIRVRAHRAAEMLQLDLDLDATVESLSVADQQVVEIGKAISGNSSMLILDEPTTALSVPEVERLHELITRLAAGGQAVLYVSHRLEELIGVADCMTVMRDGRVVRDFDDHIPPVGDIVEAMVGRSVDQFYARESHADTQVRLELRNLTTDKVHDVSLVLRRGEVLGLAGAVGSGRTEIARAIFGADPVRSGEVLLDGQQVSHTTPRRSIARGVGFVPESRKTEALFFNLPAPQNISVAKLDRLTSGPWLSSQRERQLSDELIKDLQISAHANDVAVEQLSGGNQQKIVLARWVFAGSNVLILDEPTQGIDVGAKQEVYRTIGRLTADGVAVLLISSDLPELLAMSDRLAIVRHRTVTRTLDAGRLTEIQLIEAMSGTYTEEESTR